MSITFYLLLFLAKSAFCANILYVSYMPSPSHHLWNRALSLGLADKGHNVTLIDPDFEKLSKRANFTHIRLDGVYEALYSNYENMNDFSEMTSLALIQMYKEYCLLSCGHSLQAEGLKQLLNYPADFKFDLMIFDVTSGSCLYPLIHRFNYPPTIAATAFLLPTFITHNFGGQLYPTYLPWYGVSYGQDMTFWQRIENSFLIITEHLLRLKPQYELEHELARKVFGDETPSMHNLERHISLVLTNTDPVLDYPQPLSPNFISVGGLHTKKSEKLPQDLQEIVDKATNGVIVFSLGTNVRSDQLGKTTRKALLDAFSKISQTVIWKFESEIDDLPRNVIVRKWLPQNDVLGHPNVKLFIGHGGALSTQEAIFHGVPMICIPFFVDQHINARRIVNKKIGVRVDHALITQNYMLQNIKEVLDNPIYAENMKKLSNLFNDKMATPLEKAVFYAEHVMRHGGAEYLNSIIRDMPFYKIYGLDIIAFIFLVVIITLFMTFKLIRFIVKLFLHKKKVKTN